ncbi:HNH endonuclease signature motif containing protein [Cellulosimicrobium sp. XJ-DQ-B-000]|uniref:HNH endonuclease n=1 Tax=unclassified Cellulosimicrobium TaxID=2624466 RepID=UPI001583D39C|nr:HNH endonuclease signature motif containing protein [Cellulosimicrobium sp. XJ-DQ-B-000]MDQ8040488.1 HNH endonuclease signature motif containing protein [Cellulosimicrobium sp. XJ-DQ-B-000]
MKRSKPLTRRTPLARSATPPKPRARTKRYVPHVIPARLRMDVYARAGGRCDLCRIPLAGNAFDAHHRKLRSRGGEDSLENLVALHRHCHDWVHHHPADATRLGFMVASHADPATTPLHLHGRTWVLPDGRAFVPTTRRSTT